MRQIGMIQRRTVDQILSVLMHAKTNYEGGDPVERAYCRAVETTRKQFGVTYQTIGDACRRRLGLERIGELYRLLRRWLVEGDRSGLEHRLSQVTSSTDRARIASFLGGERAPLQANFSQAEAPSETFSFRLEHAKAKQLRVLAEVRGVSVPMLLATLVSQILKERTLETIRDQLKSLSPEDQRKLLAEIPLE